MPVLSKHKKEKEYLGCLVRSDTKEVIFKLLTVTRLGEIFLCFPSDNTSRRARIAILQILCIIHLALPSQLKTWVHASWWMLCMSLYLQALNFILGDSQPLHANLQLVVHLLG